MKLYMFLRSIIWTSVLSAVALTAALITAFIAPPLSIPFALIGIGLAILSPRN